MTDWSESTGDESVDDGEGPPAPPSDEIEPPLEDLVAYEDGDYHVVCERSNPSAWIESDHVEPLRE